MASRVLALVLAGLAGSASAQGGRFLAEKKIAVLQFSVGTGVQVQAPEVLWDECSGAVAELTHDEGASVMTRQNMLELLKETKGKCVEGQCEVETAINLKVDLFVTGNVSRMDGEWILVLMAYATKTGQLLGQVRSSAARERDLLEKVRPATEALVRKAFKVSASTPGVNPPAQGGEGTAVEVTFVSEPAGASVTLDGSPVCLSTPCTRRTALGGHDVLFEKKHHRPSRIWVNAARGTVVRGSLQPTYGWLTVETEVPGVMVSLDGGTAARTPLASREVEAGSVDVTVTDRCFVRRSERVVIKEGDKVTLRLPAVPRLAGLKVNVVDGDGNGLDATVHVDGREVGKAGSSLQVPVCAREASVRVGGHQWTEVLELEESGVKVLTARFNQLHVAKMVSFAGGGSVSPFRLDVTEVTVAAYADCVKSGRCSEPTIGATCNWRMAGKEQHPVNCVDWMQAAAYCRAQGKRLPDQAEWQFAASNGGRTLFPWGDSGLDGMRAKWKSRDGTAPVGRFPAGATPSGIQDLVGNVWEWMANDYDRGKELRGGSWSSTSEEYLRPSYRTGDAPTDRYDHLGFRCAQ
ncbi:MAG: hypothetical protein RL653_560 [Pseudomonadota bacterium]